MDTVISYFNTSGMWIFPLFFYEFVSSLRDRANLQIIRAFSIKVARLKIQFEILFAGAIAIFSCISVVLANKDAFMNTETPS